MTTPSTAPVPSKNPQDLLFNAEKADEFVNGSAPSYKDRFGNDRRTLQGVTDFATNQTQALLASLGYQPPVAYGAGLNMTAASQTVNYAGAVYAPKLDQIPFTTSGTFETAKFRLIQGIASVDLAATSGTGLIGWLRNLVGTVQTTLQKWLGWQEVNIFEFMSDAQIADIQSMAPTASVQVAVDKMLNSAARRIRFPRGVYRANIDNRTSSRTFIFDEGAVIDGVVHLAIGQGPEDSGSPPLSIVSKVRVIGTLEATVRVGTFYCDDVNVDKIRISDVNAAYANQTAAGGARGVHLYYGSKNITIGEIDALATNADSSGFFVDTNALTDAAHRPRSIRVGTLRVRGSAAAAVYITNVDLLDIDNIRVDGFTFNNGIVFVGSTVRIGSIDIDGSTSTSGSNIYLLNNTRADIGDIVTKNSKQYGVYVSGSSFTRIERIEATNNASDGARFLSGCSVGEVLTHHNGGAGLAILSPATFMRVGRVQSYNNGAQGVYNSTAHDTWIGEVDSHDNTATFGHALTVDASQRFRCNLATLKASVQGLRYTGNTDGAFGHIVASGNSNTDIALGGTNTGLSFLTATYTGISGGYLQDIAGFKGKLVPLGHKIRGDADFSLVPGTDVAVQRVTAALTANRTVTLSAGTAQPGDTFRIARSAASTGAFTLSVGGLKSLSTGQWCDVVFDGSAWQLCAAGSL